MKVNSKSTSFRLSTEALKYLKLLALADERTQTQFLERLIIAEARNKGIYKETKRNTPKPEKELD
jgi:predicted DNA-binding protein